MLKSLCVLWRHRLLVRSLVSRELKARYRGSVLGFMWSFLNPLMLMGVYSLVFSVYMRVSMKDYHIFLFCGLLPWLWFSASVLEGTNSIISGASLVKKVLFPAEILPITVVFSNLLHFVLGLPILFLFLLAATPMRLPGVSIIALLPIIFVQLVFTIGLVLMLSALSVHFRDISQILANMMTLWFFLCPIIYSMEQVQSMLANRSPMMQWTALLTFRLNPMAHIVVAYQRVLFENLWPHWTELGIVFAVSIAMLFLGYQVFNRSKMTFAEEI